MRSLTELQGSMLSSLTMICHSMNRARKGQRLPLRMPAQRLPRAAALWTRPHLGFRARRRDLVETHERRATDEIGYALGNLRVLQVVAHLRMHTARAAHSTP